VELVELSSGALRVSRVALGTMTFGDQTDEHRAGRMLEACDAAGVNLLDTANSYSDGASEEVLGRLLPSFGDRFVVLSKAGGNPSPDAPGLPPLSAKAVRAGVEGSLRRLGREHLDIFLLHHPDPSTPIAETVGELGTLIAEGKILAYGASNFAAWRFAELLWTARAQGVQSPEVSELMYNLIARRIEDDYTAFAEHEKLTTIVFNPLAGGMLSGKYTASRRAEAGGRFISEERGAMYRDRYWNESVFSAVARLTATARSAGLTLVELSLQWLLSRPVVGSVLLGASSVEQLVANLAAAERAPLDERVLSECDAVWQELRGEAPIYGR
jgi:aryl-alcohol dehydrogenase-like predicted oxidoreductase